MVAALIGEEGGSPTVEVDEVVLVVMVNAVLGKEFEAFVPEALEAEVEHAAAKVVGNVSEVIFRMCSHNLFTICDLRFMRPAGFVRRIHAHFWVQV